MDTQREAEAIRPTSGASKAAAALRDEHVYLERVYEVLLNAYCSGDWVVVREQWNAFEDALRRHMAFEEKAVLPAFRAVNAVEVDALLAEHEQLKKELDTLGVNVELHCVPEADAQALIARLRAHALREDSILYPWVEASLRT